MPSPRPRVLPLSQIPVLGIPLCAPSPDALPALADALLARGGSVVTPNAEILYHAAHSPALRRDLLTATLRLADGVGAAFACRLRGAPVRPLRGIAFGEELCRRLARRNAPLFLYGGRPGVAARAAVTLTRRYGTYVCGTCHGYGTDPLPLIRASHPCAVFVCLGSPLQEEWMRRAAPLLPHTLLVGLGGSLDVWAGERPAAPRLWERLGLEWLWRALADPARIPRLAALPRFAFAACATAARERRAFLGKTAEKPQKRPPQCGGM